MRVEQIAPEESGEFLNGNHYLGAAKYRPRFCFATEERDAVAIFSDPIAASFKLNLPGSLELARLWRAEDAAFQTSQFLAITLRLLRKLSPDCACVFTYADPAARNSVTGAAHSGTVYRAANFTFLRSSRITDQWQVPNGETISAARAYRMLKTKSRERIAALRPEWKLIEGVPKLLFVFPMRLAVAEVSAKLREKLPDERRAMFSRAHGGFRVHTYQQKFPAKKCAHCRRMFLAARSDAKTCSASCRTMLYLRRKDGAKAS